MNSNSGYMWYKYGSNEETTRYTTDNYVVHPITAHDFFPGNPKSETRCSVKSALNRIFFSDNINR